MTAIDVLDGGLLTTVQDLGRTGWQRFGVPVSGAMDPWALRAANRIGSSSASVAVRFHGSDRIPLWTANRFLLRCRRTGTPAYLSAPQTPAPRRIGPVGSGRTHMSVDLIGARARELSSHPEAEAEEIVVTAIGTCRIADPLAAAARMHPMRRNLANVYGFVHTSKEVLQQLDVLDGREIPPELVRFVASAE